MRGLLNRLEFKNRFFSIDSSPIGPNDVSGGLNGAGAPKSVFVRNMPLVCTLRNADVGIAWADTCWGAAVVVEVAGW